MFLVSVPAAPAVLAIAATLVLGGCTTSMGAAIDSLKYIAARSGQADTAKLDPEFDYLRVTRGSHVGLLWRGNIEQAPVAPIEVYYSGSGEVLRLQNGRLVGALGLATEWRRVEVNAPAWRVVAGAGQSPPFVRVRDVMPGYRANVRDELRLGVIDPPSRSGLQRLDPKALTWFEETVARPGGLRFRSAPQVLPPARYAVDLSGGKETVIYSEQCLSPEFCFTWQRWTAAMQ
jgi:hypothetical protein